MRKSDYVSIPNVYQKFDFPNKNELIDLGELVEEVNIKNEIDAPI